MKGSHTYFLLFNFNTSKSLLLLTVQCVAVCSGDRIYQFAGSMDFDAKIMIKLNKENLKIVIIEKIHGYPKAAYLSKKE